MNPRYKTTEEKRYLGKLLFHDPVRTARIDTSYGGVDATKQTGSCGSCHLGEAAGKAGMQLNFNVGGEGRGYTDEKAISLSAGDPGLTSRSSAKPHSSPVMPSSMNYPRSPTSITSRSHSRDTSK